MERSRLLRVIPVFKSILVSIYNKWQTVSDMSHKRRPTPLEVEVLVGRLIENKRIKPMNLEILAIFHIFVFYRVYKYTI